MYSLFIIVVCSFLWIRLSSRLELFSWKVVVLMVFVSVRTSTTLPVCQQSQHATWPGFYRCVKLYTAAVDHWSEMKCVFFYSMCSLFFVVMEELCRFLRLRGHDPAAVIHKLREGEAGHTCLLPMWFKPQSMDTIGSRPLPQTAVTVHHKLTWTHSRWHQMKFQMEQHGV